MLSVVEIGLIFIITVLVVLIAREFLSPVKQSKPQPPPPKKEIVLREFTKDELANFTGSSPDQPIYVAVDGNVYDVSSARSAYGPGGSYSLFAGHDASYALGTFSLEKENLDKPIDNLSASEREMLNDWKMKYEMKYDKVGTLVAKKSE